MIRPTPEALCRPARDSGCFPLRLPACATAHGHACCPASANSRPDCTPLAALRRELHRLRSACISSPSVRIRELNPAQTRLRSPCATSFAPPDAHHAQQDRQGQYAVHRRACSSCRSATQTRARITCACQVCSLAPRSVQRTRYLCTLRCRHQVIMFMCTTVMLSVFYNIEPTVLLFSICDLAKQLYFHCAIY